MEPKAPPRRRPHDSMSLPVVPGVPVGQYAQPFASGPSAYAPPPVAPSMPAPPVPQPEPQPAQHAPEQFQYVAPAPPSVPSGEARTGRAPSVVVDQTNQRFELRVGSNVVGRGTDADLQLLDQGISRRHLDIQYDGNSATAYDLGSTNGTSVNGHEVGSQLLRHGDVVRVGHTRLVFHQEQV
jgi:Inner membrane component of T3SS, cytoplasmic domain